MKTKSQWVGLAVVLTLLVGCAPVRRTPRTAPRWAPRTGPAPRALAPPAAPQVLRAGPSLTRLVPARRRGRCAPIDIGHGRTVQPLCKALPPVQVRRFIKGASVRERPLPPAIDLRQQRRTGPVKNQGSVGLCWAFALSTVLDNGAVEHDPAVNVSPLHVAATRSWNAVVASATPPRLTVEAQWPYTEPKGCAFDENDGGCEAKFNVRPGSGFRNPQLQAEHRRADAAHRYTFRVVENLEAAPANPEQLMGVLAEGDAIYAVIGFTRDGWRFDAAADGVLDHYATSEQGHAVALVGYRTAGAHRQLLLQNSWGTGWGHGGFVWMDESQLVRHLERAVRLEVIPTRAAPRRAPGPQPQPQGCPAGQVPDLVTGVCSTPCGGLFPPVNGICPLAAPTGGAPSCSAGQVRDLVTGGCAAACGSGLPPAMGACLL